MTGGDHPIVARRPIRRDPWATGGLLLLPVAVFLALACGRRDVPVAPERRLPGAVQDLAATVVAEGIELTWTLPQIRADRSRIKALARTEVHRRLEEPGQAGPPRPAVVSFGGLFQGDSGVAGFERVASIDLTDAKTPRVTDNRVRHTDAQGLVLGRRYTYVVVAVDDQGRPSPPSNRVQVAMAAPPGTPTGLAAVPGDREVRLVWTPPGGRTDGSPLSEAVRFNVYRRSGPEAPEGRPLNPEPLGEPSFADITVRNETTYYYSVRALLGPGGPLGPSSGLVQATPEDRTAPAQPRGLVAVVAGATVRLAWGSVEDADLAGYHVYRSTAAGRGYQRLTERLGTTTTYVDSQVSPGTAYYYVVTAVDAAPRANESVPSPEATARLP